MAYTHVHKTWIVHVDNREQKLEAEVTSPIKPIWLKVGTGLAALGAFFVVVMPLMLLTGYSYYQIEVDQASFCAGTSLSTTGDQQFVENVKRCDACDLEAVIQQGDQLVFAGSTSPSQPKVRLEMGKTYPIYDKSRAYQVRVSASAACAQEGTGVLLTILIMGLLLVGSRLLLGRQWRHLALVGNLDGHDIIEAKSQRSQFVNRQYTAQAGGHQLALRPFEVKVQGKPIIDLELTLDGHPLKPVEPPPKASLLAPVFAPQRPVAPPQPVAPSNQASGGPTIPNLPARCESCGTSLAMNSVKWTGPMNAVCPVCGASVQITWTKIG
jgi:hypothetical protein